jgi:hypothetical protein
VLGRGDRLVRRTRKGDFEVHLGDGERELLRSLVPQLRELLAAGAAGTTVDSSLTRLFPTAYPDDAELDAEYQSLVRDELLEKRLAALDVVEETVDAERLTEEQLLRWMGSVNDLRLVLGTRLDVTEDMDDVDLDDPDAPLYGVYGYLGWLLEHIVEALSEP